MAKNDQLYTLNLTVVALVALVAIVGVTAIVLNGGSDAKLPQISEENAAGQVARMSYSSFMASDDDDDSCSSNSDCTCPPLYIPECLGGTCSCAG